MAYEITDPVAGSQQIATTSDIQRHPLGTIVEARDATLGAGTFIYLSGLASTAVGEWVTYTPDDYSTALLPAGGTGMVAVSMSINLADFFGWYQIEGKASGLAATGFADNALVYSTATAGTVDDAVVAGDRVKLALGASTVSGGLADFDIARPFVDDGASA